MAFGLVAEAAVAVSAENVGYLAFHSGGVELLLCNMCDVARLTVLHYEADRQRQNLGARCFDMNGYAEKVRLLDSYILGKTYDSYFRGLALRDRDR